MRFKKSTFDNWVITYKRFWMCVYHANVYQSSLSSLLMLHINLVHVFITHAMINKPAKITDTMFVWHVQWAPLTRKMMTD